MVTQDDVLNALREVYDPEIPISVVDLGLIYDVGVEGSKVNVKMTMTTPRLPSTFHNDQGCSTEDRKSGGSGGGKRRIGLGATLDP